jgi:hypothetical protein
MSPHRDIDELQRCLDEGRRPSRELTRRLEAQPRLRRRARALRSVDAGLREELVGLARQPSPPVAMRVLRRLDPGPRRRRAGTPLRPLALAAAAALVVWLAWPQPDEAAGSAPGQDEVGPAALVLRWPAVLEAPAPEAALAEEARRLAEDTRGVARTLWRSLPLAGWTARTDEAFPH